MSRKRKLEDGLSNLFSPQSEEEVSRPEKKKDSTSTQSKDEKVARRKGQPTAARAPAISDTKVKKPGPVQAKGKKDPSLSEGDLPVTPEPEARSVKVDSARRKQVLKPSEADSKNTAAAEEMAQPPQSQQPSVASVKDLYQPSTADDSIEEGKALEAETERYVIFDLTDITFGVDVNSVLTIIKLLPICPIPHSADYLSGLINLRGQIIPVFCLGKRLGLPERPETENSRIIVVEQEKRLFGFIVDYVRAVEEIRVDHIGKPSKMMANVRNEYLSGIAETEQGLILLLALQRLLQR